MQPASLLYRTLQFDWHILGEDEDIRVLANGSIQKIKKHILFDHPENFLTSSESLQALHLVEQFFENPPGLENPEAPLVQQVARRVYLSIFDSLKPNPGTAPSINDKINVKNEIASLRESLSKRIDELRLKRSLVHPMRKDDIIRRTPEAESFLTTRVTLLPTVPKEQDVSSEIVFPETVLQPWLKNITPCFKDYLKLLKKQLKLKTKLDAREAKLAVKASTECEGYNPFDDDNKKAGSYFEFVNALIKIKSKDKDFLELLRESEKLKNECSKTLRKFIHLIFDDVRDETQAFFLIAKLHQLVKLYEEEIDFGEFGRHMVQEMTEEQMYLILKPAILEDLRVTQDFNTIFRVTNTCRGALIGGFFAKMARQMINPAIRILLAEIEKFDIPPQQERVAKILTQLLDHIRTHFVSCSLTPQCCELLSIGNIAIFDKWKAPGLKNFICTLFLRGATKELSDAAGSSPIKETIRMLTKLLQIEINSKSSIPFQDMEKYLLALLQLHSRAHQK